MFGPMVAIGAAEGCFLPTTATNVSPGPVPPIFPPSSGEIEAKRLAACLERLKKIQDKVGTWPTRGLAACRGGG